MNERNKLIDTNFTKDIRELIEINKRFRNKNPYRSLKNLVSGNEINVTFEPEAWQGELGKKHFKNVQKIAKYVEIELSDDLIFEDQKKRKLIRLAKYPQSSLMSVLTIFSLRTEKEYIVGSSYKNMHEKTIYKCKKIERTALDYVNFTITKHEFGRDKLIGTALSPFSIIGDLWCMFAGKQSYNIFKALISEELDQAFALDSDILKEILYNYKICAVEMNYDAFKCDGAVCILYTSDHLLVEKNISFDQNFSSLNKYKNLLEKIDTLITKKTYELENFENKKELMCLTLNEKKILRYKRSNIFSALEKSKISYNKLRHVLKQKNISDNSGPIFFIENDDIEKKDFMIIENSTSFQLQSSFLYFYQKSPIEKTKNSSNYLAFYLNFLEGKEEELANNIMQCFSGQLSFGKKLIMQLIDCTLKTESVNFRYFSLEAFKIFFVIHDCPKEAWKKLTDIVSNSQENDMQENIIFYKTAIDIMMTVKRVDFDLELLIKNNVEISDTLISSFWKLYHTKESDNKLDDLVCELLQFYEKLENRRNMIDFIFNTMSFWGIDIEKFIEGYKLYFAAMQNFLCTETIFIPLVNYILAQSTPVAMSIYLQSNSNLSGLMFIQASVPCLLGFYEGNVFSMITQHFFKALNETLLELGLSCQQVPLITKIQEIKEVKTLISGYSIADSRIFINHDNWAVSIVRKPNGNDPEHAFLIVEGITQFSKVMIRRYDLFQRLEKPGYAFVEIKEEDNLDLQDMKEIFDRKFLKRERICGKTWSITRQQAIALHRDILHDNKADIKYFISGNSSIFVKSQSQDGHNCFTWAREKLYNLEEKRIQLPEKLIDFIGAKTSFYIEDPEEKKQYTSCRLM